MNPRYLRSVLTGIAVLAYASAAHAVPVPESFTYQGQLKQNGVPINGFADVEFTLWDDAGVCTPTGPSGGSSCGGLEEHTGVEIKNGLFTVVLNSTNIWADCFNGEARYLHIRVRYPSNIGPNAPPRVALCPRQPITAAPYALYALNGPASGGNTLDEAYDEGGAGAGRTINADNGAVNIAGPGGLTVNGNIGIGTSNPSAKLEVAGGGDILLSGATSDAGDLVFRTNTGIQQGRVWTDPGAANQLYLSSGDLTPDIMIDAQGRVGIGTTSPAQRLDVRGEIQVQDSIRLDASDEPMIVRQWDTATSGALSGFGRWGLYMQPSTLFFGVPGSDYGDGTSSIRLGGWLTDSTRQDWLTVVEGGNVGIGTDNPLYRLDVNSSNGIRLGLQGSGGGQLVLANNPNDNRIWLEASNSTGDGSAAELLLTGHGGSTVPQLTLVADTTYASGSLNVAGNVGIGTTSPAGTLDVRGDGYVGTGTNGENHKLVIRGPNSPGTSDGYQDLSYEFSGAGSAKVRAYRGGSWDTYLQFLTNAYGQGSDNPTVRMHISESGSVGIGTTAPTKRLHVVAASAGDGILVSGTADSAPGLKLSTSYDAPFQERVRLFGELGLATVDGGWSTDARAGDTVLRSLGFSEGPFHPPTYVPRRLILQNGDGPAGLVLSENNVGIGTDAPTASLHIGGAPGGTNGIRFPDGTLQLTAAGGGSAGWSLTGNAGTAPGTNFLGTTDNQALQLHVNGARALRLEPEGVFGPYTAPNVIGGYRGNFVSLGVVGATVFGGGEGLGSPYPNSAGGIFATVGGGISNTASGRWSTVGGGQSNTANGLGSTISGGTNSSSGFYSAVPGGYGNESGGSYSFAVGHDAIVRTGDPLSIFYSGDADGDEGTFIWADDSIIDWFRSTGPNQFLVRASGGTKIYSNSAATVGVQLAAGGNSWSAISDRNVKQNVTPVDSREVLERLAAIPIGEWNLISQDPSIRHIGPMAQDFHAAFRVGELETHISSSDADGVALAAIQGLYNIVQDKDCEIDEMQERESIKDQRINELEARLAAIETLIGRSSNAIKGGGR